MHLKLIVITGLYFREISQPTKDMSVHQIFVKFLKCWLSAEKIFCTSHIKSRFQSETCLGQNFPRLLQTTTTISEPFVIKISWCQVIDIYWNSLALSAQVIEILCCAYLEKKNDEQLTDQVYYFGAKWVTRSKLSRAIHVSLHER